EKKGVQRYWRYGLGHGVGLDIHEYPGLRIGSKDKLIEGMVFTIEPGLAIPGIGGARIEYTAMTIIETTKSRPDRVDQAEKSTIARRADSKGQRDDGGLKKKAPLSSTIGDFSVSVVMSISPVISILKNNRE
ncbi:MAG: M24 family metallopeptidase, partial [Candidatus Thorarchaeota archaeon]